MRGAGGGGTSTPANTAAMAGAAAKRGAKRAKREIMGEAGKRRIIPEPRPPEPIQPLSIPPGARPWPIAPSSRAASRGRTTDAFTRATAPRPSDPATAPTAVPTCTGSAPSAPSETRIWTATRIARAPASGWAPRRTWSSSRPRTSPPTRSKTCPRTTSRKTRTDLLRPAVRATDAIHAQRAEDRDPGIALVDGTHCGAVFLGARDLGGALRVDVQGARDRDVRAEAVPALRVVQPDRALARHVHGGAHEIERGLLRRRVIARLARTDAEDLDAGADGPVGARALLERRLLPP